MFDTFDARQLLCLRQCTAEVKLGGDFIALLQSNVLTPLMAALSLMGLLRDRVGAQAAANAIAPRSVRDSYTALHFATSLIAESEDRGYAMLHMFYLISHCLI